MAKIIWTEPALADLDAIAGLIALDKPGAAKGLVRRVFLRIDQLALFPNSGGKPRNLASTPYRQIVLPPLRIFYRVDDSVLYIVHVLRGERQFHGSDLHEHDR